MYRAYSRAAQGLNLIQILKSLQHSSLHFPYGRKEPNVRPLLPSSAHCKFQSDRHLRGHGTPYNFYIWTELFSSNGKGSRVLSQ